MRSEEEIKEALEAIKALVEVGYVSDQIKGQCESLEWVLGKDFSQVKPKEQ